MPNKPTLYHKNQGVTQFTILVKASMLIIYLRILSWSVWWPGAEMKILKA